MSKLLRYVGMAGVMLALPVATFAVSFNGIKFSNNQTTIDCTGGSTVNVTFPNVEVSSSEVIEWVRTRVDVEPWVDTSVGGTLGLQEGTHDLTAQVKCPPNTGTYDLDVDTAGIFGGNRAINGGDSVNGGDFFGSSIRVVANGGGSSGNVGGFFGFNSWDEFVVALKAALGLNTPPPPPAPVVSAACKAIAPYAGLTIGSQGPQVSALQGFLIASGQSIPAIQYDGAAYGYFGVQTSNALFGYKAVNQCN